MVQAITIFRNQMEELYSFSQNKDSILTESPEDPTQIFTCQPRPGGICSIINPSRTELSTVRKVARFVRKFEDWFFPSPRQLEILHSLQRSFPKHLGRLCGRICKRLESGPRLYSKKAFIQRQDLHFVVDGETEPMNCWVHKDIFAPSEAGLNQFLERAQAEKLEDGSGYHLRGISGETLQLLLSLCYAEQAELPKNPYRLAEILRHIDIIGPVSPIENLGQKCDMALLGKMDRITYYDLIQSTTEWDNALGRCLVRYTSIHFSKLRHCRGLTRIPPELMARTLDSGWLLRPEQANLRTLLMWAERKALVCEPHDTMQWLTEPTDNGRCLLECIRFEHFDIETFVNMVSRVGLMDEQASNDWVRRLSHVDKASELRPARGALMKRSQDSGSTVHIRWHLDNFERLFEGRDELIVEDSPVFDFAGAQWRLEIESAGPELKLSLARVPTFNPAEEGKWEISYHFPESEEKWKLQSKIDDASQTPFTLTSTLREWRFRGASHDNYLPIEIRLQRIS